MAKGGGKFSALKFFSFLALIITLQSSEVEAAKIPCGGILKSAGSLSLPVLEQVATQLAYTGPSYRGVFESHITVELTSGGISEFQNVANSLGLKPVLIQLSEGAVAIQPMTSRYLRGEITEVFSTVQKDAANLTERGFKILRTRIEAVITAEGIPQTQADVAQHPKNNYFEFHLKYAVDPRDDEKLLDSISRKYNAIFSSNALKPSSNGLHTKFVTLRIYNSGRTEAEQTFNALRSELKMAGFVATSVLKEYSVYDSDINLDRGWAKIPSSICTAGCIDCPFETITSE